MDVSLAQTPLHQWHSKHGGRLVDFAGWAMPIQYTSISAEHLATRQAATLFDVSHMGRFLLQGVVAGEWLQTLVTRRIDTMRIGDVRYSLVTRDDGGVLDDILIYRLPGSLTDPTDDLAEPRWMLVVNASNREKIWDWLSAHHPPEAMSRSDATIETAMVAVQGPLARELVMETFELPGLAALKNYQVAVCRDPEIAAANDAAGDGSTLGSLWVVSRTGYTGEDGFELVIPAGRAEAVWIRLLAAGSDRGVVPAGLGARDTLRLEAGMPLYGHELMEGQSAAAAGLKFALHLDHAFPGRDALAKTMIDSKRIGFRMDGRRVAREGATVYVGDRAVGSVTSGTFSPTLQQAIGMAYVDKASAAVGQQLEIDIRGKRAAAEVVPLPFYRRS